MTLNLFNLMMKINVIKKVKKKKITSIFGEYMGYKEQTLFQFYCKISIGIFLITKIPRVIPRKKLTTNNYKQAINLITFKKSRGKHTQILSEECINSINTIQSKPYRINTSLLKITDRFDLKEMKTNLKCTSVKEMEALVDESSVI
jgi:hypothetical protein